MCGTHRTRLITAARPSASGVGGGALSLWERVGVRVLRSSVGASALLLLLAACTPPAGDAGASKTAALERAERRAYDGAPPVIAHQDFGMTCTECHDLEGMEVEDVGFAPPSPHAVPHSPASGGTTLGMSAFSRCRQCHVFSAADDVFKANAFAGLEQDLRRGARLNPFAPPTLPHKAFMRENCVACHSGPAAREEIRTDHPERPRCRQCHVPVETRATFARSP